MVANVLCRRYNLGLDIEVQMKYQYVKARIEEAVEELCIGCGDARSRVLNANEMMVSLFDMHFPDDLIADWKLIQKQMTKYGPKTNSKGDIIEGAVSHTMRKIQNKTASKIAQNIYNLHNNLQRNY